MKKNFKVFLMVALCLLVFITTVSASGWPTFDYMGWMQRLEAKTREEVNNQKVLIQLFNTYKQSKESNQSILKTFAAAMGSEEMFNMVTKDPKTIIYGELNQFKKNLKTKGRDILGSSADKIVPERKDTRILPLEEKNITNNTVAILSGDDVKGGDNNNPGMRLYLRKKMYDDVVFDMQAKYSNFFVNPKTGKQVTSPIKNDTSVYKFIKEQHELIKPVRSEINQSESNSTLLSQIQLNNRLMLMQIQISLMLLEAQTDLNRLKLIETSQDYEEINNTVDSYLRNRRKK